MKLAATYLLMIIWFAISSQPSIAVAILGCVVIAHILYQDKP